MHKICGSQEPHILYISVGDNENVYSPFALILFYCFKKKY